MIHDMTLVIALKGFNAAKGNIESSIGISIFITIKDRLRPHVLPDHSYDTTALNGALHCPPPFFPPKKAQPPSSLPLFLPPFLSASLSSSLPSVLHFASLRFASHFLSAS